MNEEEEVYQLLKKHGAVLDRQKRHNVWKFPDGRIFTQSRTPSDWRAPLNQLSDLRRMLGVSVPLRGEPGERRPRRNKHSESGIRPWHCPATIDGALQEKLRLIGVSEDSLKEQIAFLREEKEKLQSRIDSCWGCWITEKLRRIRGIIVT